MNENESVTYFLAVVAAQARTLPLRESRALLRGCLTLTGDVDYPYLADLRRVYRHLEDCDRQLELFERPQLRLL